MVRFAIGGMKISAARNRLPWFYDSIPFLLTTYQSTDSKDALLRFVVTFISEYG